MKRLSARGANQAMTLIEVLVVVAVVALLLAMILPALTPPDHQPGMPCKMHLKQISIAFVIYADDNNGKFPMQFSVTNGGTMEFIRSNQTFPHYQKLSQYIQMPAVLVCPVDKSRHGAADFKDLTDRNLSYFLNVDVSTNNPSASILAGDRNLQANGQAVPPGIFVLTMNQDLGWTRELHPMGGNVAYADGHVAFCKSADLKTIVEQQNVVSSRLSVP